MNEVLLVEDEEKPGLKMKQWIQEAISTAKVTRCTSIEKALEELKLRDFGVIVLDMYFIRPIGDAAGHKMELADGMQILRECPGTPTVLISQKPKQAAATAAHRLSPLLQLDKPTDFFPSKQEPEQNQAVENFRYRLVEAVEVGLLVADANVTIHSLSKENAASKQTIDDLERLVVELREPHAFVFGLKSRAFGAIVVLAAIGLVAWATILLEGSKQWFEASKTLLIVLVVHFFDRFLLLHDVDKMVRSVQKELGDLSELVKVALKRTAPPGRKQK